MKSKQSGFVALETALIMPIFLFVFVVLLSTVSKNFIAESASQNIAEEASRAASQFSSESKAYESISKIFDDHITDNIICNKPKVEMDLSPGGYVTVEVTCKATSAFLPGFPALDVTRTNSSTEIVDRYRIS